MRPHAVAAGILALGLVLSPSALAQARGTAAGQAVTARTAAPVVAAGPALAWRRCADRALAGFECATLTVPRDDADATAGTFRLAVVRLRAAGPADQRLGTLFFNPGGPGVPAIDLAPVVAQGLPAQLRARFDFVVWDPRGVGRSTPNLADCRGGSFAPPATGPVDWDAVLERMRTTEATANAECARLHPDVVPYISTNATVQDLDRLRAAVGDPRITYWGTSYGTRIGYVYALAHPDRVRAMLLSSSVPPSTTWGEFAVGAGAATDTALGLLFEQFPAASGQYRRAMRALDQRTLTLPSGTVFTRWDVRAMLAQTHSDAAMPAMAAFLRTVDTALFGSAAARARAVTALDRTLEWPDEFPILGGATAFIGCLDYPQRLDAAEQSGLAAQVRAKAPITGWLGGVGLVYCEGMTGPADPVPVDGIDWTTPMLIVGATRDALTPFDWSAAMATTFRDSRLITVVSATHTPVFGGARCVDRPATTYLLTLRRPRVDITCPLRRP